VLLALALGGLLLARTRRARSDWETAQAAALAEAGWLSRELVPVLMTQSLDQVRGAWAVAAPRAAALDDRLVGQAATAPDEASRARANALHTEVSSVRGTLERASAPGTQDVEAVRADLQAANARLEQAITAAQHPEAGTGT